MSDEKNDVVDVKKYNEVIEAHNSLKTRYEKAENELKEIKESKQKEEMVNEQKKVWEGEKALLQKQIEETKKMVEDMKKDTTVVSKGVINQPTNVSEDFRAKLNAAIPEPKVRTDRLISKTSRLMHYKSPATKQYSKEDLGKGLSLHATAQRVNPELIPPEARAQHGDLKVR